MCKSNFKISLIIIVIFFIFAPIQISAQGFLKASNKQIVNGNNEEIILRGMGLGGWMIQEGYMMQTSDFANTQHDLKKKITDLIGQSGMQAFYDAWLANSVREVDIDSIASWGFNSIRLPMHYNLYTLPIESEPVAGENTWLQKGFDLTDSLLKWCSKNHIYLILDLHAAPGGQGKDAGISDYDVNKPSLWENIENWNKTVALWKKLADRYKDEEWIGGYDLINEPNWTLPDNAALKNLYKRITDSIRLVDQNHIIFIEGNWFANDYAGLTPPWDNNMVYSFHKYWTFNDKSAIQWMLNIRNNNNVPIWLGESGENSNTWFKECITLMEENKIGWAWWPLKKIDAIAGPLSIKKTAEYETLLNYWKGLIAKPTIQFATDALMQTAENAKMENCSYHPDVIDAMFRQIKSNDTKPYHQNDIPGIIYPTNFDLGSNGNAYFDKDVANYHLSTGNYVAWNQGWAYRNDGVDIQPCTDLVFSNVFNVSNTEDGEWMQFTVNTSKTALYNINLRVSSLNSSGLFHFQEDGADICSSANVPSTGAWQAWQTKTVSNVVLTQGVHKLRFYVDKGGFNVSSFEFTQVGETTDISTEFVSAVTNADGYVINIQVNKAVSSGILASLADFKVSVNGTEVPVSSVEANLLNSRIIDLKISNLIKAGNTILVSYSGNQITAADGTLLTSFIDKKVTNTLPQRFQIPVKIEVEDFYYNSGLTPEASLDAGGGTDLGYTDPGDYLDYLINVDGPGIYAVNYRISSLSAAGQIEMQLVGESTTSLHTIDLPVTGGWQTWTTVTKNVQFPAGQYILRLLIKKSGFNINWFSFDFVSGIQSTGKNNLDVQIFPNPAKGIIYLKQANNQPITYELINMTGQVQLSGKVMNDKSSNNPIDISKLKNGSYLLKLSSKNEIINYKLVVDN